MNAKMVIKGQEVQIPKGMDITLIRIVEESLNNIKLHSLATEVLVTLEFHDVGNVKLEISDNGVGFEVPEKINVFASKSKLGLIGIRERAGSIGTLHIQSAPGQGTRISVECKP